jgi:hypothetical protein
MRRIGFILVLAIIVAGATGALAQTGGAAGAAAGGAAAPGVNAGNGTGGHAVGSPSAGRLGSGAAPNGTVQQHPTEPGCPGSALPSTTPGMKPAC